MIDFEELDYRPTPMGELVLRRRGEPKLDGKTVYEVKLGDDFLMSSLFVDGEIALATLGLDATHNTAPRDVVVGGLGLGYTAAAALDDARTGSLVIVDTMADVIDWHRKGLVPLGSRISDDARTRYLHGDFFALCAGDGFGTSGDGQRYDAVLLDIDHSPSHVLDAAHERFYTDEGLAELRARIKPGGVFALWSNDPPEDGFQARLENQFSSVRAEVVSFDNPFTGGKSSNTIYLAGVQ